MEGNQTNFFDSLLFPFFATKCLQNAPTLQKKGLSSHREVGWLVGWLDIYRRGHRLMKRGRPYFIATRTGGPEGGRKFWFRFRSTSVKIGRPPGAARPGRQLTMTQPKLLLYVEVGGDRSSLEKLKHGLQNITYTFLAMNIFRKPGCLRPIKPVWHGGVLDKYSCVI